MSKILQNLFILITNSVDFIPSYEDVFIYDCGCNIFSSYLNVLYLHGIHINQ